MGYTDYTLGMNARKGSAGPMGRFKGKAAKASDIKPGGKSARGPATSGAPGGKKKK